MSRPGSGCIGDKDWGWGRGVGVVGGVDMPVLPQITKSSENWSVVGTSSPTPSHSCSYSALFRPADPTGKGLRMQVIVTAKCLPHYNYAEGNTIRMPNQNRASLKIWP